MDLQRLFRTIVHLHLIQIFFQIKSRIIKESYANKIAPICETFSIKNVIYKYSCISNNHFSFLNISSSFTFWNETSHGMLWAYNLNYMDWLMQEDMDFETGSKWINKFIDELPQNKIGLDPYPIALRGINLIKFISMHQDKLAKKDLQKWNDSLYSQYCLLEKKLEYHLLGNHLLEDAYSLYIASIYFQDSSMYSKASKLLRHELDEQILADGAHYEQSPMYHCILLDRLLDCYNFSTSNNFLEQQEKDCLFLKGKARKMLGHLKSMLYSDMTFPLFNDSALNIAPTPILIFEYAERLGLEYDPIPLKECGYRKLTSSSYESFIDVGNMTASYQPGHSHADTFNYELRINGKPFIIDTGISTYNKTERRQYERSTAAHNTVSVSGKDSSEVWSGFRVGKRAKVQILEESADKLVAQHDGFGKKFLHIRSFSINDETFQITDKITSPTEAISYIHLAPNIRIISNTDHTIVTNLGSIRINGADSIEVIEEKVSNQYNLFTFSYQVKIHFTSFIQYEVTRNKE